MLQHRQLDDSQPSGHIPSSSFQSTGASGEVSLSTKPSHPSVAPSASQNQATSTSELTLQHDFSPPIKSDNAPVASLNLEGNIDSSSGCCGVDVVGGEEAGSQTHSYQVWNGKNDNTKSVVLAHPSQGSSTYKANGIQMHSERLNNNDDNELTSLNPNGAHQSRTLQYGFPFEQFVTPIEESM